MFYVLLTDFGGEIPDCENVVLCGSLRVLCMWVPTICSRETTYEARVYVGPCDEIGRILATADMPYVRSFTMKIDFVLDNQILPRLISSNNMLSGNSLRGACVSWSA